MWTDDFSQQIRIMDPEIGSIVDYIIEFISDKYFENKSWGQIALYRSFCLDHCDTAREILKLDPDMEIDNMMISYAASDKYRQVEILLEFGIHPSKIKRRYNVVGGGVQRFYELLYKYGGADAFVHSDIIHQGYILKQDDLTKYLIEKGNWSIAGPEDIPNENSRYKFNSVLEKYNNVKTV